MKHWVDAGLDQLPGRYSCSTTSPLIGAFTGTSKDGGACHQRVGIGDAQHFERSLSGGEIAAGLDFGGLGLLQNCSAIALCSI